MKRMKQICFVEQVGDVLFIDDLSENIGDFENLGRRKYREFEQNISSKFPEDPDDLSMIKPELQDFIKKNYTKLNHDIDRKIRFIRSPKSSTIPLKQQRKNDAILGAMMGTRGAFEDSKWYDYMNKKN